MKSLNRLALLASVTAATLICALNVGAQGGGGGGGGGFGGGGGGGGRRGGGNFDPAQAQQFQLENIKERLEITDDGEWNAIRPLVEKVLEASREASSFPSRVTVGRGGGGGRRGGGDGGGGGGGGFGGGGGGRGGGFGGTPNPAVEALTAAIDSGSTDQMKAALARYREARKEAETKLTVAQDTLKKVLKVKQEAVAIRMGLVN